MTKLTFFEQYATIYAWGDDMNTQYLRYAVEIEKTRSINKAAENLFMGQPNLSRAIKELEESIGFAIFNRTSRGITVTWQGEEFLQRAKVILKQLDEMESLYTQEQTKKQTFSISVPRASYLSHAFSKFAAEMDMDHPAEFFYRETNSSRTINNLLHADYNLGILRYAENFDRYFQGMLAEKSVRSELITSFSYVLVMSRTHPLADKENITFADLSDYIEIAHGDPYVPSVSLAAVRKEELPDNVSHRIYVFERASQLDLLGRTPGTFMWVSPFPQEMLDKYGLVQRRCEENTKVYKDVLIYREDYTLSDLDKHFMREVHAAAKQYMT